MAYAALTPYASGGVPTAVHLNQYAENIRTLRRFLGYGQKLYLSGDQNIANNSNVPLNWASDRIAFQTDTAMWSSANPSRLLCPIAGLYLFVLNVAWRTSTGGERGIGLIRSTDGLVFDGQRNGANQGGGNQSSAFEIYMAAGAYVQAYAYQNNGSTIGVHGGGQARTHVFQALRGI